MKTPLALICVAVLLSGCYYSGPAISKSNLGNLEINVVVREGLPPLDTSLMMDGVLLGHFTSRYSVLYAKRGLRQIRIECEGFKPYATQIHILGDPNHQVLNAVLERK